MSVAPVQVARVSMMMQGNLLLGTLQQGQVNLMKVQQQIATGQRLGRASEDPGGAMTISSMKRELAHNASYATNLEFASRFMATADHALGELNDVIVEAKSIASSQIGAASSADERAAQAQVISSMLARVLDIGNRRFQGQAVFGGQNTIADPFVSVGGGYKYVGTNSQQAILTPTGNSIDFTMSGDQAFGAVSSQMIGYQDLTPALTATTRLSDMRGAQLAGITKGPIDITIGATTTTVDLGGAETAGDAVAMINAALLAAGSDATASLGGPGGGSLVIAGDSTQIVTIADNQGGTTAADFGIAGTIAAAGTMTGAALQPRITMTTPLASLNGGAGIDPAGIILSNGANSATISLTGLTTVEDFVNAVNGSGTHVRAEINGDGDGINLFNPLSGTALRVGENGGNTAHQLGIRSMNPATNLADFNNAGGVTPISTLVGGPKGPIVVTKTDGTQFSVTLDGVSTPSQLIAAINSATGNTTVTAALNATGNGITLTDTAGGPGNLTIAAGSNFISNGTELGILGAGAGGTLAGTNITFSTDDFRITRRDGTSFTISVTGVTTVQDLITRINTADGNTTPATQVTASLNPTGNGIRLSDASAGAGLLTVTSVNSSEAAGHLGILQTAGTATPGVITGTDTNPLQPRGVFSSLTLLRDSLLQNDNAGIMRAAALLETDSMRAIRAQGIVGARENDVEARLDAATSEENQLKQALSLLADTDFTEAATLLQQLQTAYQASLQVAQVTRNSSLLDFLK